MELPFVTSNKSSSGCSLLTHVLPGYKSELAKIRMFRMNSYIYLKFENLKE